MDQRSLLRRLATSFAALSVLAGIVACGGDDGAGPEQNLPPRFTSRPAAVGANGTLLRVVPGDQIAFSARAIDPDVEDVSYRWELDPATGAGFLAGATTAEPVWTVGQPGAAVQIQCTISDGRDSVTAVVGRDFLPGSPVDHLTVSSDTTWTLGDSPYVIIGDLTIAAGASLRIEAGVELQFRADRFSGVSWDKRSLTVHGALIATGELQDPVLMHGGFSAYPGTGTQQFKGIVVADDGQVELRFTRVEEADVGLRDLSNVASTAEFSNFRDCGTGVRIDRGLGTTLIGCLFRDNSVGLQLNSSSATVEGCQFESSSLYGIDVDASNDDAALELSGCIFRTNLQAHLRMGGVFPNHITATVRGTNFIMQSGQTPSINLASNCLIYTLDLRGNYWGPDPGPADIRDIFAGDRFCDAGVMSWTDSDCGGDPDACDWSPQPW